MLVKKKEVCIVGRKQASVLSDVVKMVDGQVSINLQFYFAIEEDDFLEEVVLIHKYLVRATPLVEEACEDVLVWGTDENPEDEHGYSLSAAYMKLIQPADFAVEFPRKGVPMKVHLLWKQVVISKFGLEKGSVYPKTPRGGRSYGVGLWKFICKQIPFVISNSSFQLGNGRQLIRFWIDIWCTGRQPLRLINAPNLFRIVKRKQSTVAAEIVTSELGQISINLQFYHPIEYAFMVLVHNLVYSKKRIDNAKEEGVLVWGVNEEDEEKDGFSVKAAAFDILNESHDHFPFKSVWRKKLPLKIQFFIWKACLNKISSTYDLLWRTGKLCVNHCPLCLLSAESAAHLLLHCRYSSKVVWWSILGSFGVDWAMPMEIFDVLVQWRNIVATTHRGKVIWGLIPYAILWCIWEERNARCFNGEVCDSMKVVLSARGITSYWCSTRPEFKDVQDYKAKLSDSGLVKDGLEEPEKELKKENKQQQHHSGQQNGHRHRMRSPKSRTGFSLQRMVLLLAGILFSVMLAHCAALPATFHLERVNSTVGAELSVLLAKDQARHSFMGVVDFPVMGDAHQEKVGMYFTRLKIGNPPKEFHVVIDTASEITWVNCISCTGCSNTSLLVTPSFFNPSNSSSAAPISCSGTLCTSDAQLSCSSNSTCTYSLGYDDGSATSGYFVSDVFSLDTWMAGSTIATSDIVFGCSTYQSGGLTETQRALDGVLGLGPQRMSVISQLASSGNTPAVFSHCLRGDGGGVLVLGQIIVPRIIYSPLDLSRISVSGRTVPVAPDVFAKNRGTIVDSGTALAYLTAEAYDPFVTALAAAIPPSVRLVSLVPVQENQCFNVSSSISITDVFPLVSLNFSGGASMVLKPEDYLWQRVDVGSGIWCNGFLKSQGITILGDLVLKNKVIVYDLAGQRLGWADYNCSSPVNVSSHSSRNAPVFPFAFGLMCLIFMIWVPYQVRDYEGVCRWSLKSSCADHWIEFDSNFGTSRRASSGGWSLALFMCALLFIIKVCMS